MIEVELIKFKTGVSILEMTDPEEMDNVGTCLSRLERVKLVLALLSPRKRHVLFFEGE